MKSFHGEEAAKLPQGRGDARARARERRGRPAWATTARVKTPRRLGPGEACGNLRVPARQEKKFKSFMKALKACQFLLLEEGNYKCLETCLTNCNCFLTISSTAGDEFISCGTLLCVIEIW